MPIKIDGKTIPWEEFLAQTTRARIVNISACPEAVTLPILPMAKEIMLFDLPNLTHIEGLQNAKKVYINLCPQLRAVPDLPAATILTIQNCDSLISIGELPELQTMNVARCAISLIGSMPKVENYQIVRCPQLTSLPPTPNAKLVQIIWCDNLKRPELPQDAILYIRKTGDDPKADAFFRLQIEKTYKARTARQQLLLAAPTCSSPA